MKIVRCKKSRLGFAVNFERICSSEKGSYLEIHPDDIMPDTIYEPQEHKYRHEPRYKNCKYYWYQTYGKDSVKVYYQINEVDYADYKVGYYYVSVDDVEFDSMDVPIVVGKQTSQKTLF